MKFNGHNLISYSTDSLLQYYKCDNCGIIVAMDGEVPFISAENEDGSFAHYNLSKVSCSDFISHMVIN